MDLVDEMARLRVGGATTRVALAMTRVARVGRVRPARPLVGSALGVRIGVLVVRGVRIGVLVMGGVRIGVLVMGGVRIWVLVMRGVRIWVLEMGGDRERNS